MYDTLLFNSSIKQKDGPYNKDHQFIFLVYRFDYIQVVYDLS